MVRRKYYYQEGKRMVGEKPQFDRIFYKTKIREIEK
jgi:hypothetical protein